MTAGNTGSTRERTHLPVTEVAGAAGAAGSAATEQASAEAPEVPVAKGQVQPHSKATQAQRLNEQGSHPVAPSLAPMTEHAYGMAFRSGTTRTTTQPGEPLSAEETRVLGTMEPRTSDQVTPSAQPFQFDSSARADQKYTLAFTDEELEALEDVKLELRRRYDVKTTKTELVRCGLRDLLEDYARHGEQSRVLQRLRARSQPSHRPERTTASNDEAADGVREDNIPRTRASSS